MQRVGRSPGHRAGEEASETEGGTQSLHQGLLFSQGFLPPGETLTAGGVGAVVPNKGSCHPPRSWPRGGAGANSIRQGSENSSVKRQIGLCSNYSTLLFSGKTICK